MSLLEALLNRIVALDPQAATVLAPLNGRRIALALSEVNIPPLQLDIADQRVHLSWQPTDAAPADLRISGSIPALLGFFNMTGASGAPSDALPPGVQIYGDIGVAKQLLACLRGLQLDLEEPLSLLVGDVLARKLGLAGGGVLHWVRETAAQALHNAGEVLAYEQQLVAAGGDQLRFSAEVHDLRDSVARLEARIALLGNHNGPAAC